MTPPPLHTSDGTLTRYHFSAVTIAEINCNDCGHLAWIGHDPLQGLAFSFPENFGDLKFPPPSGISTVVTKETPTATLTQCRLSEPEDYAKGMARTRTPPTLE